MIFLPNFLDIWIKYFTYFLCGHHAVHSWHIYVHYYEFISLLIIINPLLTFYNSFLAANCLVSFYFVIYQKDILQNHHVEYCVVHDQNGSEVITNYLILLGNDVFFFQLQGGWKFANFLLLQRNFRTWFIFLSFQQFLIRFSKWNRIRGQLHWFRFFVILFRLNWPTWNMQLIRFSWPDKILVRCHFFVNWQLRGRFNCPELKSIFFRWLLRFNDYLRMTNALGNWARLLNFSWTFLKKWAWKFIFPF